MPGGGPIMPTREKPQEYSSSICLEKVAGNIPKLSTKLRKMDHSTLPVSSKKLGLAPKR